MMSKYMLFTHLFIQNCIKHLLIVRHCATMCWVHSGDPNKMVQDSFGNGMLIISNVTDERGERETERERGEKKPHNFSKCHEDQVIYKEH